MASLVLTDAMKARLLDAYEKEQRGIVYCSQQLGLSPRQTKNALKEMGVRLRTYQEANTIANQRKAIHTCDKDFFSKQSHDMAWLVGFLAADGCIRKKGNEIKITLARTDKEILERIRVLIQTTAQVKDFTDKQGCECSTLRWTCEQHKKDLAQYHVIPAKTFSLKPPILLGKKYWIDYIRGYFDGDRSVDLIKNSNGRGNVNLGWQLCAATPDVLQWIIDYLASEHGVPKVNILVQQRAKHQLYYFQYSSVATRKIYKVLYGTSSTMFLERKKKHYEDVLSQATPLKPE